MYPLFIVLLVIFVFVLAFLYFLFQPGFLPERRNRSIAPNVLETDNTLASTFPEGSLPPQMWTPRPFPQERNNEATVVRSPENGMQGLEQRKFSGDLFYASSRTLATQREVRRPEFPQNQSISVPKTFSQREIPLSDLELEMGYESGLSVTFDEKLGATVLITTNIIMRTPAEVAIGFNVCLRRVRAVLKVQGLERAAMLTDIAGLVVGREVTAIWGQALKQCFEQLCQKGEDGNYLVAHYDSRTVRPSAEQFQEKLRLIQFMTSASLNHFQSNIFGTREEAVAFLQRLKTLHKTD